MVKIEIGFLKQGLMKTLGANLGDCGEGRCEITLPFSHNLTQQHGLFHGGVIATIADTCAGFAAYSLMSDNFQPLTVEFKINFLAVANGNELISRAQVLKAGLTVSHVQSEVFCIKKGEECLVAVALVTVKSSKSVVEIPN